MAKWTPEQQREHRKLWVDALRSGKFQQGTGYLNDGKGHMCCLGVACEISGLGRWHPDGTVLRYLDDARMAPDQVRDWLGLNGKMGGHGHKDNRTYLTVLNDAGTSFDEIANIIEAEPAGLIAAPVAA